MSRSFHLLAFVTTAVLAPLSGSVLAGDVTGAVAGGTLTLTAGATDESITIDQVGVANAKEFRVSPGAGTTVNGGATPVIFQNVKKDIVVDLGDGMNSVAVDTIKTPRDLIVKAGAGGSTSAAIAKSTIGDDLTVTTLGAATTCSASTTSVKGDVKFTGGPAIDVLSLLIPTRVGGDVIFRGNAGADQLNLRSCFVKGKIDTDGGLDDDTVSIQTSTCNGALNLADPSGTNNYSIVLSDIGGAMKATLGSGTDNLFPNESLFEGPVNVDLGAGTNAFNMFLTHVLGSVKVKGGSGADHFQTGDTCFIGGNASIALGDGMNSLSMEDSVVAGAVKVTGGSGDDSFTFEEGEVEKDVRVNGTPAAAATQDTLNVDTMAIRGSLRFSSQSEGDAIVVRSVIKKNVDVKFFGSMNSITLDRSRVRQLRVSGQGGVDDVIVENESNIIDDTDLDLGDGNNVVMLLDSVFGDDLKVRTGAGNDTLTFTNAVFGGSQDIDTGSGTDVGP